MDERDPITGHKLKDHDFDGIRELDVSPPRWWFLLYAATIVFSLGYWLLYPAWPSPGGFTEGLLGWTSRGMVGADIRTAALQREPMEQRVRELSAAEIRRQPDLLQFAMAGGRAAYLENCAQCHGEGGQGRKGFPTLLDDDWLWGGSIDEIATTIRHGIRSDDAKSRASLMPAFGTDGILKREQIADVADYVLTLSQLTPASAASARGKPLYEEHCESCHGKEGVGNRELGAPALNDRIWLYGDSRANVIESIVRSRRGVMPSWQQRLSEDTIKKLVIYVHEMGGGE